MLERLRPFGVSVEVRKAAQMLPVKCPGCVSIITDPSSPARPFIDSPLCSQSDLTI